MHPLRISYSVTACLISKRSKLQLPCPCGRPGRKMYAETSSPCGRGWAEGCCSNALGASKYQALSRVKRVTGCLSPENRALAGWRTPTRYGGGKPGKKIVRYIYCSGGDPLSALLAEVLVKAMMALRQREDLESNPGTSSGQTLLCDSRGLVKRLTQIKEGESVPLTAPGLQVGRTTFLTSAVLDE